MRKLLYGGVVLTAVLCLAGFAYASGIAFNGSTLSLNSGSVVSISPSATPTIFGYSTHPPSSDATGLAAYYQQLLGAGATWQRTDLMWFNVQSTSSASYTWGSYDNRVNEALAGGISTILVIDETPQWAAYAGCTNGVTVSNVCAPANATTLATFCSAAATRYNGKINYWEIWNEQNANSNWGPAATSSDYVTDFNACRAAIKAVNSSAVVMTGGLNYSGNITVAQSITDYINDGAQFDMVALHPYTFSVTVNDPTFGWGPKVDAVRAQLNAAGDSAVKIAITEYGAPTCGSGSVSLQNQQQEAAAAIATSTSAYMNLFQPIFWYTLVDANSLDPSTSENCYGVYYTNGIPKPAYSTLRSN